MKNKPKILLVDGNNALYRAYYKFNSKGFTNGEGFGTGAIYGFFKILHANVFRFQPDHLVICFDQSRSKHRMETLPQYKENRKKIGVDFESMGKQKRVICRILRQMGIPYIKDTKYETEYEGDDFIALMYQKNATTHETIILSSDEDFVQLLNFPNTKIINPSKDLLITTKNCEEVYGYKPSQAVDMKILCGDTSDNIPGFKGVGPKTAIKFLEEYESIHKYLEGNKQDKKLVKKELSDIYNRNKFMVDLMYYLTQVPIDKVPVHQGKDKMNSVKLNTMFNKYKLMSFMSKEFIQPFKNLKKYDWRTINEKA